MIAIKLDLEVTDQLFGRVDPHIADRSDHGAITSHNRHTARIAPGRDAEGLGLAHRHDLGMTMTIKLRHIAARHPSTRADTGGHRIADRVIGVAIAGAKA